jgi:para-aminobenzoate synthetase/4-amino-4-deoxychorismate lyase
MPDQALPWPTALIDFPAAPTALASDTEAGAHRQRLRFGQPLRWLVAHDPTQVASLLDDAHALSRSGHWCVGWVAYEAAPAFDPSLPVKALPPGAPYAVWAIYAPEQVHPWQGPLAGHGNTPAPWQLGPWAPDHDTAKVHRQVEAIRELIRQGEVYQINLTGRLHAPLSETSDPAKPPSTAGLIACFEALQRGQPGGYSLFLDSRAACRGPGAVLSVSPELFFDWQGDTLTTRPMKGTSARSADASTDQAQATHLRHSPKERAENLMIVDLLRNDLSKVAQVGSVEVPSLFDVQALPTVWQMTSTVQAKARVGLRLSEVFTALFPCGSVTGAPKRQAMHHIARLESSHRGVYCGASGLMSPGGRVTLNVPIRTVSAITPPPNAPWRAVCGIGSGITLDATPEGEALEWQHKQAFLQRALQLFELLESLRLEDGTLPRLELHLARLARSAAHFAYPFDTAHAQAARQTLSVLTQAHPQGVFKVRLLLDAQGQVRAEAAPLPSACATPLQVALATHAMPAADEFIRHKTTQRSAYDAFKARPGFFDTLLFNAQGELTEFTIGNLAVRLQGDERWYTPPVSAGLLPGVMRESLLAQGKLTERSISLHDLPKVCEMALINSVRGWVLVQLHAADTPGVQTSPTIDPKDTS